MYACLLMCLFVRVFMCVCICVLCMCVCVCASVCVCVCVCVCVSCSAAQQQRCAFCAATCCMQGLSEQANTKAEAPRHSPLADQNDELAVLLHARPWSTSKHKGRSTPSLTSCRSERRACSAAACKALEHKQTQRQKQPVTHLL